MRASARAVWFGLGVLVATPAAAADHTGTPAQNPDIELLEYLGTLVEEPDTWVGPEDMQGSSDEHDATIVFDADAADAEKVK